MTLGAHESRRTKYAPRKSSGAELTTAVGQSVATGTDTAGRPVGGALLAARQVGAEQTIAGRQVVPVGAYLTNRRRTAEEAALEGRGEGAELTGAVAEVVALLATHTRP